ncbi:MAG TPA: hypothetical protein PKK06_12705 [Phycisphaerae bacterium]|nr:hypothetical protein [Phycisphaerae bacterium]HNU45496.1 hypothetical protein [Phycisphaerae bacterium]
MLPTNGATPAPVGGTPHAPTSVGPPPPTTVAPPVAQPFPPRFWWLKRIVVAVLVLLLALLGLRLWWGWEAQRRFDAAIAAYRAAGEPVFPEDFLTEQVPDEDNAARVYDRALQKLVLTTAGGVSLDDLLGWPETFRDRPAEVRELVEANAEVFLLLEQARTRPTVGWNIVPNAACFDTATGGVFTTFQAHRNLSRLAYLAAWHHHEHGDDGRALVIMAAAVAHARAIARQPLHISQLVASACAGLHASLIEEIIPDLWSGDVPQGEPKPPYQRERVRGVIAELLDDAPWQEGAVRGFLGERALLVEAAGHGLDLSGGAGGPRPLTMGRRLVAWAVNPSYVLEVVAGMRLDRAIAQAMIEPTYPAARGRLLHERRGTSPWERWNAPLRLPYDEDISSAPSSYYRSLARRRLAATALAIRWYAVDHGGRPTTLEELVPGYLPAVPLDPLASDGSALRYCPAERRPVLYSVGENGIDDGGTTHVAPADRQRGHRDDMLFFLAPPLAGESDDGSAASSGKADADGQQQENQDREAQ